MLCTCSRKKKENAQQNVTAGKVLALQTGHFTYNETHYADHKTVSKLPLDSCFILLLKATRAKELTFFWGSMVGPADVATSTSSLRE